MKKKNIALVAGGFTNEFQVSLNSAQNIASNLDKELFNVYEILITRQGWLYSDDSVIASVNKNDFTIMAQREKIFFDMIFITIHGSPGEDGKLQGYLDMLGLPYNTCNATTAALTMNKAYTKDIVKNIEGLCVASSLHLIQVPPADSSEITGKLRYPLFVKPNNGGSSVSTSKVHDEAGLDQAIKKAFAEDNQVLVEEFIKGREFSIGLAKLDGALHVLPLTEIIPATDFFDYEAKYTPGMAQEITPAILDANLLTRIDAIVREVYRRLNCQGMVRIDFILEENTNDFYFIEINTTPGQSSTSLIPQQVRAAGMDLKEFYTRLIDECLRNYVHSTATV